ncbi:MAG: hypothetical protein V4682_00690 [Patescibacteria group bacterium]
MRTISLLELLGIELIARLRPAERLKTGKDAFLLLAKSQNDSAAETALEAVYLYMVPTQNESPYCHGLPVEDFHAKRRAEQLKFFEWLESVYWSLPLYKGDCWEERTNGFVGFQLHDPLRGMKKKVMSIVAEHAWNGQTDELGLRAFEFLLACTDSFRFRAKAIETTKAVAEYRERFSFDKFAQFELPREDIKATLEAIRASAPTKSDELRPWLIKKGEMPHEVWKIFAHAFVNAGGEINIGS